MKKNKKKLDSHFDLYKDAFKEMKEEKNNWNWVNSLKKGYKKPSKGEIEIYLKRIKRTRPFQIGYKVEDLDEDIRRLEKIVEITQNENFVLENEKKGKEGVLRELEAKLENAENFMFDLGDVKYSMNLMRNLERDYCLVKKKIRELNNEIFDLKNSEKYFEYVENKTIVKYYKNEIDKFDLLAKEIVKKNKYDFQDFLKRNKEKIRKREIRLKKYCNLLEKVENEIFGIESKKFDKKKQYPNLKSLIKKKKKNLKTKKLLKNKIKNQEQRIEKLKKYKNSPEFIKNLNNEKTITFEINIENKLFFKYIIIYLQIYKLQENYITEMTEEMKKIELEKRKNIFFEFFDFKKKNFKRENFELLKKKNLESLLDNYKIFKKRFFDDKEIRGDLVVFQDGIKCFKTFLENEDDLVKIDLFVFLENFNNFFEIMKFLKVIFNFDKIEDKDDNEIFKIMKENNIDQISFDFLENSFLIKKIKIVSEKIESRKIDSRKNKSISSFSEFTEKSKSSKKSKKKKSKVYKKSKSKSSKSSKSSKNSKSSNSNKKINLKKSIKSLSSNEDFFDDEKSKNKNSKENVENHLNELIDDMNKFEEKNNYSDFFEKSFSEKSEANLSFT